jgi:hypothetical protein
MRAGAPPSGFGARSTIAEALAAACGRPVDAAFRAAIAPPALLPAPKPQPCPPCPPLPPVQPAKAAIVCPTAQPPAACPQSA